MKQPRLSEMIEKILESEEKPKDEEERQGFGKNMRKQIISEEQQALEQFTRMMTQRRINTL